MSFTELELILMGAFVVVVVINNRLTKRLDIHREAHAIILHTINAVADKKVAFHREADGSISIKPTNSQEQRNAPSI